MHHVLERQQAKQPTESAVADAARLKKILEVTYDAGYLFGPARAETWTIEEGWDQLVSLTRKGFEEPHFQYCDGTRFWKGMPKANDGRHNAGGPEHDELPGKIASLIGNLIDNCFVGIYFQSALAGVSESSSANSRWCR